MIPRSDLLRHHVMGWGKQLVFFRKYGIAVSPELQRFLSASLDLMAKECNACALSNSKDKLYHPAGIWAVFWAVRMVLRAYCRSRKGEEELGIDKLLEYERELGMDDLYLKIKSMCLDCLGRTESEQKSAE